MIDCEDIPNITPNDASQRTYAETDASWETIDNAPIFTYCHICQEAVMYRLEHEIYSSQDPGYGNQYPSV